LLQKSGITAEHLMVVGLTIVLLATKKIPAPLIVLAVLVAGIVF